VDDQRVALHSITLSESKKLSSSLSPGFDAAIQHVIAQYGSRSQETLLRDVYRRYPWFASKSELTHLVPPGLPDDPKAPAAIYTAGYQMQTVDAFLCRLLRAGITHILDVRANPVSRNYGFAGKTLSRIAEALNITYDHLPQLGIRSEERKALDSSAAYKNLFRRYEQETLKQQCDSLTSVWATMKRQPSVLLCYEADPDFCHRGRLAEALSSLSGLPVVHLNGREVQGTDCSQNVSDSLFQI
jgi:uncharacterized protein (DUF488 family)